MLREDLASLVRPELWQFNGQANFNMPYSLGASFRPLTGAWACGPALQDATCSSLDDGDESEDSGSFDSQRAIVPFAAAAIKGSKAGRGQRWQKQGAAAKHKPGAGQTDGRAGLAEDLHSDPFAAAQDSHHHPNHQHGAGPRGEALALALQALHALSVVPHGISGGQPEAQCAAAAVTISVALAAAANGTLPRQLLSTVSPFRYRRSAGCACPLAQAWANMTVRVDHLQGPWIWTHAPNTAPRIPLLSITKPMP